MVYAIASRTIDMFEVALGRGIHWRRADRFGSKGERGNAMWKTDVFGLLSSTRTQCNRPTLITALRPSAETAVLFF
jgi:hypothetical protein